MQKTIKDLHQITEVVKPVRTITKSVLVWKSYYKVKGHGKDALLTTNAKELLELRKQDNLVKDYNAAGNIIDSTVEVLKRKNQHKEQLEILQRANDWKMRPCKVVPEIVRKMSKRVVVEIE